MNEALIQKARMKLHRRMIETDTLTMTKDGIISNADTSSRTSKDIARETAGIISRGCGMSINVTDKISGQTLGRQFEELLAEFLSATFLNLEDLCPGRWVIRRSGFGIRTSDFAQYEHLETLNKFIRENPDIAASLGNSYVITPDIVICRELYEDEEINRHKHIVDNSSALASDIRKSNGGRPILHASISAKYTLRSDRAQNSRTEALSLIRNRKGHLPHITVVTAEPMPGRLASIALGTGDIDCVYHFALYELERAVKETASDDSIDMLNTLINGKRLKDISDLPLDLAI